MASFIRPVITRDDAIAVGNKVLNLSTSDTTAVSLVHHAYGVTRTSRTKGRASKDGETVTLAIQTAFGEKGSVNLTINQLDDTTLKQVVPYLESLAKSRLGSSVRATALKTVMGPRTYLPVGLWHNSTIEALVEDRTELLPAILEIASVAGLKSAVFMGASARATCIMRKDGLIAYGEETDAEVTVTCWTSDGKGSGWGGSAARDWNKVDPMAAARQAVDIAKRSTSIESLEPGRRTAILGSAAVAQLVRQMSYAFDAERVHRSSTPHTKGFLKSKIGERLFDPRITIRSDPNDLDGGYLPFFFYQSGNIDISDGMQQTPTRFVEDGVLTHLAYNPWHGASMGVREYAQEPKSIRLEAPGGQHATVEEMIANCQNGVYINRFSDVSITPTGGSSGQMSGLTRDGCFLVRNGKIDRAVKNFRFVDSPWFMFNSIDMIGKSKRAALGYISNWAEQWPLPPVIVPPIMVRDFNLVALADAI